MDNLTQLTDKQREIVIKQLQERLSKIESLLDELAQEKKEIFSVIHGVNAQLTNGNQGQKRQSILKGHNFNWKTVSMDILKDKRRLLTTNEVYNEFLEIKPEFKTIDYKNIQASFSSALTYLSDDDEVVKIPKKYGKGSYWGLPDWFPNGTPLPEIQEQLERYQITEFVYVRNSVKKESGN